MNRIRKFLCNVLDWHKPSYLFVPGVFNCNTHSYCRYCDVEIVRDSQGNWFSINRGKNDRKR
jgi:hypothetical protein